MIVSLFKNFNEIDKNLKIIDLLQDIKSGTYRNLLTYLRKSLADNKMEAYERAKKSLPAFTLQQLLRMVEKSNSFKNTQILWYWISTKLHQNNYRMRKT